MAQRSFNIVLPADTNFHNLYSLIVGTAVYGAVNGGTNETGITGAVPVNGIFPDRVSQIDMQIDPGNAGNIIFGDRNNLNTNGPTLAANQTYTERSTRNTICLKDFFIKGSVASQKLNIGVQSL